MNGLLLQPTIDHLFDLGFLSFDDTGRVLIFKKLGDDGRRQLHVSCEWKLRKMPAGLKQYLKHHREQVFRK